MISRHRSNEYQLFSVLVHTGGMQGGHYFAYINPTGSQWLKFDDDKVQKCTEKEATESQFGANEHSMRPSSNAYMLVYVRKSDWSGIVEDDVSEAALPDHLRSSFKAQLEKELRESEERDTAHLFSKVITY